MRRFFCFFIITLTVLSLGTICLADDFWFGTSSRMGGTTFHNFGGTFGTSSRTGGTTFHNYSDGTTGTSQNIGGTVFHNFNN